ncbi:MAG: SDR family NAD(P)-dependent oxidoreductase [Actinomycetota bacterium]|nr:SDR family NAD(P)-dependent oxidoreductase [Actinomycetota bacterium]|tara:strand:+ start:815 stop:1744 length:930 start_codon:yes stop_codon:yes gene_type:complete
MGILDGKVALVTGAGRGIGREHALMMASEGAKVVVNDLGGDAAGGGADATPAQNVVAEIEAMGGEAVVNGGNVAVFDEAGAMVQQAIDTFGDINIIVNNAGILRDRMLFSMSEDDWDAVIAVHLKGTFAPSNHAAKYWREKAKAGEDVYGRIINTASPSGIYGNVGQTNYGAAKAGIAAFSLIAAQELTKYGVTVNCLAPTAWSRMTADLMGGDNAPEGLAEAISPRWIAVITTWLASPEAQNVTGRCFDIRGENLGIAEGWHLGPVAKQTDDPADMGPVVAELMSKARLNASMAGTDHEGPGFPSQSI